MKPSKHIYTTIIMLVGLLLPVLLLFSACSGREMVAPAPVTGATSDKSFNLSPFRPIPGTEYLMAHVVTEKPSNASYGRASYTNYEIRNVVFLNGKSLASTRLLTTNTIVILDATMYTNFYHDDSVQDKEQITPAESGTEPVKWLVYQLVKEDTNNDGILDQRDLITVAVSDVDGQNYSELLDNISAPNSMNMVNENNLVIVYTQNGESKASILDLKDRVIADTRLLIEIEVGND